MVRVETAEVGPECGPCSIRVRKNPISADPSDESPAVRTAALDILHDTDQGVASTSHKARSACQSCYATGIFVARVRHLHGLTPPDRNAVERPAGAVGAN